MEFNQRLKYLRKKEKLTQEELAEKLNVSRQAVTKWESGQALPDISNLKEIANLFQITIDELLDTNVQKEKSCKKPKNIIRIVLILVVFISVILIVCKINNYKTKLNNTNNMNNVKDVVDKEDNQEESQFLNQYIISDDEDTYTFEYDNGKLIFYKNLGLLLDESDENSLEGNTVVADVNKSSEFVETKIINTDKKIKQIEKFYNYTNEDKNEYVEALYVLFEDGTLGIIDTTDLKKENYNITEIKDIKDLVNIRVTAEIEATKTTDGGKNIEYLIGDSEDSSEIVIMSTEIN